jgi:REP element-mobilizing transposase RayT
MFYNLFVVRFAERFKIESSRLAGWNYSGKGIYFITICTRYQNNFFGKIMDGKMIYKVAGEICVNCINEISKHFPDVRLIESVVMPNHVHILFHVETHDRASLQDNRKITLINLGHKNHPDYYSRLSKKSNQVVPNVIKQLKSSVKRKCNQQKLYFVWQDRYYDEVIKDNKRLNTIKYYIKNNIKNWQKDKLYRA